VYQEIIETYLSGLNRVCSVPFERNFLFGQNLIDNINNIQMAFPLNIILGLTEMSLWILIIYIKVYLTVLLV